MKKVRIVLSALVRLEYVEDVEVPDHYTRKELDALVEQKYDDIDGGEYYDDPGYWEKGHCYWEDV